MIERAVQRIPVCRGQNPGDDITLNPLLERKKALQSVVKESERLAVSRYFEGNGTALYERAQAQSLEGIVGKRKESLYFQGKRTHDWKKIKYLQDDDYVVCGYIRKDKHMSSLILAQYDAGGILQYKGHVTLGVGGQAFQKILEQPRAIRPPVAYPAGHGNEDAVWILPALVCKVEYMEKSKNGSLRQPVFRGLREDKRPEKCIE